LSRKTFGAGVGHEQYFRRRWPIRAKAAVRHSSRWCIARTAELNQKFQFGWPLGMSVVDHVDRDIWEVRTRLANRLARVLFVLEGSEMVLLHGFIKKERTTPKLDLDLARQRLKKLRSSS
jgi:phage-related protein